MGRYLEVGCIRLTDKDVERMLAEKCEKIFPLSQQKRLGIVCMAGQCRIHTPRKERNGLFHAHSIADCYTCDVILRDVLEDYFY